MNFLLEKDWIISIEDDVLDDLLNGNTSKKEQAEIEAIAEISSYLNVRYDVQQIFPELEDWSDDKDYLEGKQVHHDGKIVPGIDRHHRRYIPHSE